MNKEKIKEILDVIAATIISLGLVYNIPTDSPALKLLCKSLNDLEELLCEGK